MTTAESGLAGALVDAIVARDLARAVALMHPAVDFRAMTPNRVWEAADPAGVEAILRQWFEDPDEDVQGIAATEPTPDREHDPRRVARAHQRRGRSARLRAAGLRPGA